MSQLGLEARRVTPALRLGVACAAGRFHQDVRLSAGARQLAARWRIAAAINLKCPRWRSRRLVRDARRRSMPAPRATNATLAISTARTAARFAFGWGLAGSVHTVTRH
jgi:hypothetical protein